MAVIGAELPEGATLDRDKAKPLGRVIGPDLPEGAVLDRKPVERRPTDPAFTEAMAGFGADKSPDTAIDVLNFNKETGLNNEFIEKNLDTLKKNKAKGRNRDFILRAPATTGWGATSPHHMSLVQEDETALTDIEGKVKPEPITAGEVLKEAFIEDPRKLIGFVSTQAEFEPFFEAIRAFEAIEAKAKFEEEAAAGGPGTFFGKTPEEVVAEAIEAGPRLTPGLRTGIDRPAVEGRTFEENVRIAEEFLGQIDRPTTFGAEVASVVTQMIPFAQEIAATGGAGVIGRLLGKRLAVGTLKRFVSKEGRAKVTKAIGELGIKTTAFTAGGALQALPAGSTRILANTLTNLEPERKFTIKETGEIESMITAKGDDFIPALTKAYGNSFVEIFTERLGRPLTKAGSVAKKAFTETAVKFSIISAFRKANPSKSVTKFKKLLDRFGWNGIAAEIAEERAADVLRPVLGLEEEFKWPSLRQWQVELVAFGLPGTAFGATASLLDKISVTRETERKADIVKEIGKDVAESKLHKRSPELFAEVVDRMAEGTDLETVAIPVEAWDSHFEELEIDPREITEELLGDATLYDTAVEEGKDIEMSFGTYAAGVAATEHNEPLSEEMKITGAIDVRLADELLPGPVVSPAREARLEGERLRKELAEAVEKARVQTEKILEGQIPTESQRIVQDVTEQIEATGVNTEDARLQAEILFGEPFRLLAERAGLTPEELFEQFGPTITRVGEPTVEEDVLFQRPPEAPTFFSQLERVVETPKFPSKASGESMINFIRKGAVKAEEIKWSGIEEFLKGKKSVTKEEVQEFLKANAITVVETQKGEVSPEDVPFGEDITKAGTQFEDQTLPGGTDYTEMLLRLPVETEEVERGFLVRAPNGDLILSTATRERADEVARARGGTVEPEIGVKPVEVERAFTGGHFDEPNVVSHVRFNTRIDSEGNKVLFLEEIQSDWAAAGRRRGFEGEFTVKKIGEGDSARWQVIKPDGTIVLETASEATARAQTEDVIPAAPFLKNWHELTLKRMLRHAAENDFDKMAWITGEQTADRYDLSKQVDEIRYRRDPQGNFEVNVIKNREAVVVKTGQTHSDLESLVGKDITKKMETGEGALREDSEAADFGFTSLSGDGLKVGGQWAFTLYDKVVPNFLKKYGKRWGVKVEKVDLSIAEEQGELRVDQFADDKWGVLKVMPAGAITVESRGFETRAEAEKELNKLEKAREQVEEGQSSIDITDEMRESVLAGQPLFQAEERKGRGVKGTGAQASIIFGPTGVDIRLFASADTSSLIHEIGHLYLRILDDLAQREGASEDLRQDHQTVLDWLGAKPGQKLTVAQQEKWARGIELYLRDGKAPTSALREAFARFKEWLITVYNSALELNVELSPEVRSVMDRLLASQEDIDDISDEVDRAVIDLVTEGKAPEDITNKDIEELVPEYKPPVVSKVKKEIRDNVGLNKKPGLALFELISKDKNLEAAFKKSQKAAKAAFKAGETRGIAKEKKRMREIAARVKARTDKRIDKILTDKQKQQNRRRSIRVIRDYLGLSDAQMTRLTKRRNLGLMTDYEFKTFKDKLLLEAERAQEESIAKSRVAEIITRKRLQKVNNYRNLLDLPPHSQMTVKQLEEWADALEVFEEGDIFIGPRQLETVRNTPIADVKTWRQAKEALAKMVSKREGREVTVEDLSNIVPPGTLDRTRFDSNLVERDPFFRMLVEETTKALFDAELRAHDMETELFRLARASQKSQGLSARIKGFILPQDKQIMTYMEAEESEKEAHAKDMTPEQMDLAYFMEHYFAGALEYLKQVDALADTETRANTHKGRARKNYFVHIRRSFLENLKEGGFIKAVKELIKNNEEDAEVFTILRDERTKKILPLNKHFKFAMRRSGNLDPTSNVTKAFLIYMSTLEKKKAIDSINPMMDIYVQAVTPVETTATGLETDPRIKDFTYQWLNNKKGRKFDFGGIVEQGRKIDLALTGARTFTSMLDLGGNLFVGAASLVGELSGNFVQIGALGMKKGVSRQFTKKGRAILNKYEAFVGRSAWQEFWAPGKELPERLMEGLFMLFHINTVQANKQFLLASLNKEEYDKGEISVQRLAEMRLAMGRFRVVPGTESIIGATTVSKSLIQYKRWAVPMMRTAAADISILVKDLKAKPVGEALTTREAREIARIMMLTTAAVIVAGAADEDDDSFLGKLKAKMRRESLSLMQSWDPALWLSVPRSWTFLQDLVINIKDLITLEEFKTKPGLKGVSGLRRQFTPAIVRNIPTGDE